MPLGEGENRAAIYERGGTRKLFDVHAQVGIEWGRQLDGISRATLSTSPSKATSAVTWAECCTQLSQVHPWAHELVIYRNDQRVWEGPVRRPIQNRAGVTIVASDVLGWSERITTLARVALAAGVRAEALLAVQRTFAAVDPNVLAHVQLLGGTALTTDRDVKERGGYYSADLDSLVSAGLFFTVVGRAIVLWADTTLTLGRTSPLNTALHLVGDVETAREGDSLATRAWAVNDDNSTGSAGGTDAFYGLVERVLPAAGAASPAALTSAATQYRKLHYPAPQSLTVPDGATLTCDAPVDISELVPGVLTQVQVTDLCWPVEQTMMLTAMSVKQTSGGETVGVTYGPVTGDED